MSRVEQIEGQIQRLAFSWMSSPAAANAIPMQLSQADADCPTRGDGKPQYEHRLEQPR